MALIARHGSEVGSVFDLVGRDENALTSALGFGLANCPVLLTAVLYRLSNRIGTQLSGEAEIAMEVQDAKGRTDLEIRLPDALLIFEAKRDWLLPSVGQLGRYASRVRGSGALVTLSQASPGLAAHQLPERIRGVPVVHPPRTAGLRLGANGVDAHS